MCSQFHGPVVICAPIKTDASNHPVRPHPVARSYQYIRSRIANVRNKKMKLLTSVLIVSCCFVLVFGQLLNSTSCSACTEDPQTGTVCNCDVDCELFGDCCGSLQQSPPSNDQVANPALEGLEFVCQSIYLDSDITALVEGDAFWMVTSCSEAFIEEMGSSGLTIEENCKRGSRELPPVTDTSNGIVYKNEYCAFCNNVDTIVAWQPNLACTPNVYELLRLFNISTLLSLDPDIFQRECQPCSYRPPDTASIPAPPRSCFPNIATCLDRAELNAKNTTFYTQEQYNVLANDCVNGPYDLVNGELTILVRESTFSFLRVRIVYRNRACMECNEGQGVSMCFEPHDLRVVPFQCMPTTPNLFVTPSQEPSITEESTTTESTTVETTIATTEEPTTLETTDEPPEGASSIIDSTKCLGNVESESGSADSSGGSGSGFPRDYAPCFIVPEPDPPIVGGVITITEEIIVLFPDQGIPYTITLSNLGRGLVSVSTDTERANFSMKCPEGEALIGLKCRQTLCPQGFTKNGGKCQFPRLVPFNNSSNTTGCSTELLPLNDTEYVELGNNTIQSRESIYKVIRYDNLGRPLICLDDLITLDCSTALVPLNNTEYIDLGNDSLLLGDEVFEIVHYDDLGRPLICPDNITTVIIKNRIVYSYPEGFLYLTYIGCSLSVIGCALVLITYGLFKELRTLPGKILMNLAATILMSNVFILAGGPLTQAVRNAHLCTSVAILLHFIFLAQFTWMSVMSFEMARTFNRARKLILDSDELKRNILLTYLLIGWGVPLTLTLISIIVNYTADGLVLYGVLEDGRVGSCWINHSESVIVAFAVPLIISVVFNGVLFFFVSLLLCKASISQTKLQKQKNIPYVRVNFAIFTITGLTWVFGFVALLAGTAWSWYLFIILNSTQGFIIFIAFLFSIKTLKLYLGLCGIVKEEKTSSKSSQKGQTSTSTQRSHLLQNSLKTYETA